MSTAHARIHGSSRTTGHLISCLGLISSRPERRRERLRDSKEAYKERQEERRRRRRVGEKEKCGKDVKEG